MRRGKLDLGVYKNTDAPRHDARTSRGVTEVRRGKLDLGRTTRLASPALRRAVTHRDHHCVWPGCDRPAPMRNNHHLVPWHRGGETSLTNLALVCGHHQRIHHGWQLTLTNNGHFEVAPPYVRRQRQRLRSSAR